MVRLVPPCEGAGRLDSVGVRCDMGRVGYWWEGAAVFLWRVDARGFGGGWRKGARRGSRGSTWSRRRTEGASWGSGSWFRSRFPVALRPEALNQCYRCNAGRRVAMLGFAISEVRETRRRFGSGATRDVGGFKWGERSRGMSTVHASCRRLAYVSTKWGATKGLAR